MSIIDSLLAQCRHFLRGIFRRDDVERVGDFVLAQVRPAMLLLLAGSLVLLLVACVNVTHLFLARAVSLGNTLAG